MRSWEFAHQEGIPSEGQDSVDSPECDKSHSLPADLLFLIADESQAKTDMHYRMSFKKDSSSPIMLCYSLPKEKRPPKPPYLQGYLV